MELIFNHFGEFRWSSEDPVVKSTLLTPTLVTFGSFIRSLKSVQMLKGVWGAESYITYSYLVKLQPWFLSLRWKTCFRKNCNLGFCACSEEPALGQNTMMRIMTSIHIAPIKGLREAELRLRLKAEGKRWGEATSSGMSWGKECCYSRFVDPYSGELKASLATWH